MRRKDLVTTTMALTLAVFMSAVCTGCGQGSEVEEKEVAVETTTESTIEEGYTIDEVEKPYDAMVSKDCSLLDSSDAVTEITPMTKESYVTVYGDVYKEGVQVDYYAVELDDGTRGFIEGKNLDFNVTTVEDYADSLEEIEGGDGTEEEETTEVIEVSVESFEPYQMYTNTSCNVRAQASKDSELVATLSVNTEITVIGVEGDWSKVEVNGLQAYIKSSLLSKDKVVVEQPSSSSSGQSTSSGQSQSSSNNQSSSSNGDTSQTSDNQSMNDLLTDMFGNDGQGTGGYDGGTTGSTTDGQYGGVQ